MTSEPFDPVAAGVAFDRRRRPIDLDPPPTVRHRRRDYRCLTNHLDEMLDDELDQSRERLTDRQVRQIPLAPDLDELLFLFAVEVLKISASAAQDVVGCDERPVDLGPNFDPARIAADWFADRPAPAVLLDELDRLQRYAAGYGAKLSQPVQPIKARNLLRRLMVLYSRVVATMSQRQISSVTGICKCEVVKMLRRYRCECPDS